VQNDETVGVKRHLKERTGQGNDRKQSLKRVGRRVTKHVTADWHATHRITGFLSNKNAK